MLHERIHLASVVAQSVVWVLAMVRCVVGAGARARILFRKRSRPEQLRASKSCAEHSRQKLGIFDPQMPTRYRVAHKEVADTPTGTSMKTSGCDLQSTERRSTFSNRHEPHNTRATTMFDRPHFTTTSQRAKCCTTALTHCIRERRHDAAHIHAHMHATCAHAHIHLQPWSASCARDLMRVNPMCIATVRPRNCLV